MAKDHKSDCRLPEFPSGAPVPTCQGLHAPTRLNTELVIPRGLFDETLAELQARSARWRESAAILCGHVAGSQWIADVAKFYHRLCDDRGRSLSIILAEAAKFQLYEELNRFQLRLIAGIHTHPEDWVDLSWIDQRNQLCSKKGFWSIVVPSYGQKPWLIENMGVHIRTSNGWRRLTVGQIRKHVSVTESASWKAIKIE